MTVSNTSPLYYLHQLGCIELLSSLFGRVYTTPQVADELAVGANQGVEVPDISGLDWCIIQDVAVPSYLDLIPDLGRGEASVIALAVENQGSTVILDDMLGRTVARGQGIAVTGTLGVLLLAKQSGAITSIADSISKLRKQGFFLSKAIESEALRLAGEA